ncbi:MAG: DUF983 domain-containing protein [Flavobacteriales bacterium]
MKKTNLGSVIWNKCPKCRTGNLFVNKSSFRIKGFTDFNDNCPHCAEDFQREPGFYFGASYVSYGLTVAIWVAVYVALITFNAIGLISYTFSDNPWTFLIIGVVTLLILLPAIFRLSRSLWISMFVKFKKS